MTRKLRSNFEPGTSFWAVRRAQWKALGLTDEDMEKPKIAVVNSSSELAICFSHLDGIAKRGEGRDPRRRRPAVRDPHRRAERLHHQRRPRAAATSCRAAISIVNDMEIAVEGAQLDGMICLSSCDKTPPAHLMAAGRFNIPTILVICGYQPSGDVSQASTSTSKTCSSAPVQARSASCRRTNCAA